MKNRPTAVNPLFIKEWTPFNVTPSVNSGPKSTIIPNLYWSAIGPPRRGGVVHLDRPGFTRWGWVCPPGRLRQQNLEKVGKKLTNLAILVRSSKIFCIKLNFSRHIQRHNQLRSVKLGCLDINSLSYLVFRMGSLSSQLSAVADIWVAKVGLYAHFCAKMYEKSGKNLKKISLEIEIDRKDSLWKVVEGIFDFWSLGLFFRPP